MDKRIRILFALMLLVMSSVSLAEVDSQLLTESFLKKNTLNAYFGSVDGVAKDETSFGLEWKYELDYVPFTFDDHVYKFSMTASGSSSESKIGTEKVETDKYGIGLQYGASETIWRFKPFISFGIENLKESKRGGGGRSAWGF